MGWGKTIFPTCAIDPVSQLPYKQKFDVNHAVECHLSLSGIKITMSLTEAEIRCIFDEK